MSLVAFLCAPQEDAASRAADSAARERADAERIRDAQWIAQFCSGDITASERVFAELFQTYGEPLIRFATSYVRDSDAAREIVSDVLLAVWEHRASFAPEYGVGAYLFGAVRNRAHNAERSRQRRERTMQAAAREPELPGLGQGMDFATRDDITAHTLLVQRVHRALDGLPANRREAMVLRWEHGMTPEQIAAVMGITRAAVYHLLERARQTLRDLLGPDLR